MALGAIAALLGVFSLDLGRVVSFPRGHSFAHRFFFKPSDRFDQATRLKASRAA
jgi:hypothetical protein